MSDKSIWQDIATTFSHLLQARNGAAMSPQQIEHITGTIARLETAESADEQNMITLGNRLGAAEDRITTLGDTVGTHETEITDIQSGLTELQMTLKSLDVPVVVSPLVMGDGQLSDATVGAAYSTRLADLFTGGDGTVVVSCSPSSINGLAYDPATTLMAGTPEQPVDVSLSIGAIDQDGAGVSASGSRVIRVGPAVVTQEPETAPVETAPAEVPPVAVVSDDPAHVDPTVTDTSTHDTVIVTDHPTDGTVLSTPVTGGSTDDLSAGDITVSPTTGVPTVADSTTGVTLGETVVIPASPDVPTAAVVAADNPSAVVSGSGPIQAD